MTYGAHCGAIYSVFTRLRSTPYTLRTAGEHKGRMPPCRGDTAAPLRHGSILPRPGAAARRKENRTMLESCDRFRTMQDTALADVLIGLITDVRAALVHTGMGQGDKLIEIHRIVDSAAPPPPPA